MVNLMRRIDVINVDSFKEKHPIMSETISNIETTQVFDQLKTFGFTGETYYDYDKDFDKDDPIVIIHFNDVYNVEQAADGSGGISRFASALQQFSDSNPLILFSGDAFNPSFTSSITKGKHMVPFLNMLKVHTACVGNHDLDFGVDHLEYLTGSTRFPWLLSNVFDAYTPYRPLAGANLYRLFEWQGRRIGIIGLVEQEWICTLSVIEPEDIIYKDYVQAADELCQLLRSKECELIIALTHMRAPNDERLAREAKDLDLILGGHDHEYYGAVQIGNCIACKSGTDFREFTVLKICPGVSKSFTYDDQDLTQHDYQQRLTNERVFLPSNKQAGYLFSPRFCGGSLVQWNRVDVDPTIFPTIYHIDKLVEKYMHNLQKHLDGVLGETAVPLETRFSVIRKQETNVGNWLADLLRTHARSMISFFNAGTVRSDKVIPPGVLRLKDLVEILPMTDELVVLEMTGKMLIETLEVSVSTYPKSEGRFLQISGFRYKFDSSRLSGNRVIQVEIQVYDDDANTYKFRPLDSDEILTACTKLYLAQGKDGFSILKNATVIVPPEDCPNLPTLVQNSFRLAALASGTRKPRNVSTSKYVDHFKSLSSKTQTLLYGISKENIGDYKLNCVVENRIVDINVNNKN